MITIRRSNERGHARHGWLDSFHTFSFADYYDPNFVGFRDLRVINEDRVAPGQGFGTHGHADMEILSYVVSGELAHKDSMGNVETIKPHEWQRMSAGTGVRHSEYNASEKDPVHFFQIWIFPEKEGLAAGYEQKLFAPEEKSGRLKLVASPGGNDGSISINQNVRVYNGILNAGDAVRQTVDENRHAWLQVISGAITLNDAVLKTGDGAAISDERLLAIAATEKSEILLFDLA